ncbi:MAG: pyridoxamine 5'-phosphate oxidase family protein [Deltaproteobacteria bacterium]|nr:pyridoxamine 5'-phosphate oxidase family protein [Deltaproteobacteria bacterium]
MPNLKPGDEAPFTGPDPETELRKRLTDLFTSQKLAVLATQREGQPYSSLVAFAATPDLRGLVFATFRSTRKFENLTADPRAALLIDNRSNQTADFREALAVTAVGEVVEIVDDLRTDYLNLYLGKHPQLQEFVAAPDCALLQLEVETYIVVEQFQKVLSWGPKTGYRS